MTSKNVHKKQEEFLKKIWWEKDFSVATIYIPDLSRNNSRNNSLNTRVKVFELEDSADYNTPKKRLDRNPTL